MCDIVIPIVQATKRRISSSSRASKADKLKIKISIESEVLRQYFYDWVDSVYANPKGFLTEASIKMAEDDLLNFSKNESVQIEVMKIAIKSGWRDLSWAIKSYQDTHKSDKNNFASYSAIKSSGTDMSNEVF